MELNKIYNWDCMDLLKLLPDKCIDLVLTDPPYAFLNGNTQIGGEGVAKNKVYPVIKWDNKPSQECINEIIRVSKNQIIFGFEHLSDILPKSRGVYCWDKKRPNGTSFSEFELIWTSFDKRAEFIRFMWNGMLKDSFEVEKNKIQHPTQKPLEIIKILLQKHSKEGDIVLDCFMGSGTTAVACKQLNRNYICCEISKEYCDIANERLKQSSLNNYNK